MKLRLTLPQEMLNKTIDVKSTGKKNAWFALVCSEFHERSVAKDSHGCALCCQSRLWGFHRWRAVENIAAKERENPVPGSSSSVQVGGLQVGSRVVYLDVLGISLRFGIVVSLRFFHCPQHSPTTFWCEDAASSRTVP